MENYVKKLIGYAWIGQRYMCDRIELCRNKRSVHSENPICEKDIHVTTSAAKICIYILKTK